MASLTAFSLFIRIVVFLSVLLAVVLIMTAPGVGFHMSNKSGQSNWFFPPFPGAKKAIPLNIGHWNAKNYPKRIWGQMAVTVVALLFSLPPLIFSCLKYKTGSSLNVPQIIFSLLALLLYLALAGVELWYATGFGHFAQIIAKNAGGTSVEFVVIGWAFAAALFCLCALLQLVDGILVCCRRGKYHVMFKYYS